MGVTRVQVPCPTIEKGRLASASEVEAAIRFAGRVRESSLAKD